MNHIKKFNQINESSDSSFLLKMNPRVDKLIEYLQDYKEKINSGDKLLFQSNNQDIINDTLFMLKSF